MAGYTRQSVADIINGANITAPPLNSEFNQLQAAFAASTGHSHDGTTGNSPPINLATSVSGYLPAANGGSGGLNNLTAPNDPTITNDSGSGYAVGSVWINTSTDEMFVCTDATAGAAIWQKAVFIYSSAISPAATNTVDIGTSSLKFKDIYIDGTGYIDALSVSTTSSFTGTVTTGNISQTSGTATFATVDVNGGAIDATTIGATTASTIVGTTITANTGFTGNLTGNVTYASGTPTSSFYNLTVNGTLNAPNSNITGNITATTGTSTFNNVTITGTLDMDANTSSTITGLTAPTNSTDAATKAYVDTSISNLVDAAPGALDTLNELAAALNDDANFHTTVTTALAGKLALAGGTMTGAIDMGANKITTTYTPTNAADLTTKTYTDSTFLKLAGGTMTGGITMGANVISATYTPTNGNDLTNKTYVDSLLGSGASAAASAAAAAVSEANAATSESNAATSEANAATSESNAATSASNASTSATNAASSESNALTYKNAAEAAYDSFDDRYLGAKASAPSTDNDGNALLDGALYWDTTLNVLRVYDLGGTAWATIADADDVATVAANITDVNTFAARYRIGGADPTTSLDAGDLFYNTSSTQLKVYNGTAWEVGVAAGSGTLIAANNLSDVASAATSRANLDVDQAGTALALSIALG
jgi:hypothetical protein